MTDHAEHTAEQPYGRFNVTARFRDMAAAQEAIELLEEQGIAGSNISLLGPAAEAAAEAADTSGSDVDTLRKGTRATVGGGLLGTAIGAVLGFLVGLAAFGGLSAAVIALAIGLGVAGGGVGFTAGAMLRMKQSQAWELTLGETDTEPVIVGVHADEDAVVGQAVGILRETRAEEVRRDDGGGGD